MKDRRLTTEAKQALLAAVKEIESKSSVEVVVAVRKRATSYLGVHLLWGVAWIYGALVYQLYAPQEFALHWILVNPLLVAALWFFLLRVAPPLARACVPRSTREAATRKSAQTIFYERGVRMTSERVGILVVFYQLERQLEVLVDQGVTDRVPAELLANTLESIRRPYVTDQGFLATAAAMVEAGEVLAEHLPVGDDDVNELSDEVVHD